MSLPAGITLVGAAPLSCGAPLRRAGGGHARHSLASLCRNPRGKSVNPLSNAGFRGSPDHSSEGSVKGEGEGSGGGDGGPVESFPGRGFEGAGAPRQPQCITLGRLAPRHYALRRRPRCPRLARRVGAPCKRGAGIGTIRPDRMATTGPLSEPAIPVSPQAARPAVPEKEIGPGRVPGCSAMPGTWKSQPAPQQSSRIQGPGHRRTP